MPTVHITDRALIAVDGEDAEHFLQNILTVDLGTVGEREARPGALLTPQGKILFDFLIMRGGSGGWLLDVPARSADEFLKRLALYRLRAKVTLSKQEQSLVAVAWDDDSDRSTGTRDACWLDKRFGAPVRRFYGPDLPDANASIERWSAFRIASGIPESGADFALGDAFPHDVLLDQMGGVGFRKGCYVGQEVVSRMQHRGTARRRILLAQGDGPLPPTETPVVVDGRTLGTLGGVDGDRALAMVRIDRVKEAMDEGKAILAGDVELTLSIPDWAAFTFPSPAPEDAP